MQPSIAFNLQTFEVCLEFHDSSHDHTINQNHANENDFEKESDESVDDENENKENHDDNVVHEKHENELDKLKIENVQPSEDEGKIEIDDIDDNSLFDIKKESSKCKQPFEGGYFVIILSNGLSNVAFKFQSISFQTNPTDVIETIKVRNDYDLLIIIRICRKEM